MRMEESKAKERKEKQTNCKQMYDFSLPKNAVNIRLPTLPSNDKYVRQIVQYQRQCDKINYEKYKKIYNLKNHAKPMLTAQIRRAPKSTTFCIRDHIEKKTPENALQF